MKFAVLGIALALVGCTNEVNQPAPQKLRVISTNDIEIVCIDGVQYYSTTRGLTPRLRISKQNGFELGGYECN